MISIRKFSAQALPALLQACTQAAQKAAPGASAAKQLLDFMLQSVLGAAVKVSFQLLQTASWESSISTAALIQDDCSQSSAGGLFSATLHLRISWSVPTLPSADLSWWLRGALVHVCG